MFENFLIYPGLPKKFEIAVPQVDRNQVSLIKKLNSYDLGRVSSQAEPAQLFGEVVVVSLELHIVELEQFQPLHVSKRFCTDSTHVVR